MVLAVMAGGKHAFLRTKEGAEDSYEDGAWRFSVWPPRRTSCRRLRKRMTPFTSRRLTRAAADAKIIRHLRSPR